MVHRSGAGRDRRELDALAADHTADEPAGGGELVGVGAAVEAQHASGPGQSGRDRRRGRGRSEAPEVKSTTASPGGSPSKAFSTIARTRSTTAGTRGGGHGQHVPDLLDDLLVSRVGEQHPVGTTARAAHQPHWCTAPPRSTSAPLVRAHALHHHPSHQSGARGRDLSDAGLPTYCPLGDCGGRTSFVGQGGIGVARATFVRRHRVGIASGVALAIAAAAVVGYAVTASGYKKHEAELNDGGVWVVNGKKGWSGRLNKPINQLDGVVPERGRQDPARRRPGRRRGRHASTSTPPAARPSRPAASQLQDGGLGGRPVVAASVADGRRHARQRRRRDRRGLGGPLRPRGRQARHELGRPAVRGDRRGRCRCRARGQPERHRRRDLGRRRHRDDPRARRAGLRQGRRRPTCRATPARSAT